SRPAGLRQDQARPGCRPPRLQRAQPPRPEDASPRRNPHHLLLLLPCRPSRLLGNARCRRPRCPPCAAAVRGSWASQRPSDPAQCARNLVPKVRHIACKLMKIKDVLILDNNRLIFYASFQIIEHLM